MMSSLWVLRLNILINNDIKYKIDVVSGWIMVILEEMDNEECDRSFWMLIMTNDFQVQLNIFLLKNVMC